MLNLEIYIGACLVDSVSVAVMKIMQNAEEIMRDVVLSRSCSTMGSEHFRSG